MSNNFFYSLYFNFCKTHTSIQTSKSPRMSNFLGLLRERRGRAQEPYLKTTLQGYLQAVWQHGAEEMRSLVVITTFYALLLTRALLW